MLIDVNFLQQQYIHVWLLKYIMSPLLARLVRFSLTLILSELLQHFLYFFVPETQILASKHFRARVHTYKRNSLAL